MNIFLIILKVIIGLAGLGVIVLFFWIGADIYRFSERKRVKLTKIDNFHS